MEYICDPNEPVPPVDRGYVVSMVVASFRGCEDVEVHLFKPIQDSAEAQGFDWQSLLGEPIRPGQAVDSEGSRKVLLETFTAKERNQLVEYLQDRYASKLSAIKTSVLDFPIPLGLTALSDVDESGSLGKIHLNEVPNFSLNFQVHGLFDLSQHKPSE